MDLLLHAIYIPVIYRVWGNLPYTDGDYLTDQILRMVYPQYQDSSYFHNETGFSSATPYGDTMDVLFSDAPTWILAQYDTIVVASNITGGPEIGHNLEQYVYSGGNLVITSANLATLSGGVLGIDVNSNCQLIPSGTKVVFRNGIVTTEHCAMHMCGIKYPQNSTVLAKLDDSTPVAVKLSLKKGGSVTVFASPHGLCSSPVTKPVSEVDETLTSPYPLLSHAQILLDSILSNSSLFSSPGANLSLLPTFLGEDEFLLLVTNPELKQQPMKLVSTQGEITSLEEIHLDQSEKGAEGYLPDGYQGTEIGNSTNTTISGGDTRLFAVKLSSQSLQLLSKVKPKPRPIGVALHLRSVQHSVRHEILQRPSFFQHYDSVVVDYSYIIKQDAAFLNIERQWLEGQGVSVLVNAAPSIDLFPYLRLVNNSATSYKESIILLETLVTKMSVLGSTDLILSLHRVPENDFNIFQTLQSFNTTLHYLISFASDLGVTIHVQDAVKNPLQNAADLAAWLDSSGLSKVKMILNTAILFDQELTPVLQSLISQRTSVLLLNAPDIDLFGVRYSVNVPVSRANNSTQTQLQTLIQKVCLLRYCPYQTKSSKVALILPIVMDAYFSNVDEEYFDVNYLESVLVE